MIKTILTAIAIILLLPLASAQASHQSTPKPGKLAVALNYASSCPDQSPSFRCRIRVRSDHTLTIKSADGSTPLLTKEIGMRRRVNLRLPAGTYQVSISPAPSCNSCTTFPQTITVTSRETTSVTYTLSSGISFSNH